LVTEPYDVTGAGGRQEPHEVREGVHVVDQLLRIRQLVVHEILRRSHHPAAVNGIRNAIVTAFVREQLVGDALLDVVRFAGEDDQRFVLRLPAKPRHGAVVPVAIGGAENSERLDGAFVEQDGRVLNRLDEAEAEHGCRDAKAKLAVAGSRDEVGLRNRATAGSAGHPGDREQLVDSAVGGEADFANRSVFAEDGDRLGDQRDWEATAGFDTTCGLFAGLVPPTAGCAWQLEQLFMLKRGPRPASVSATLPETD
jgi:hypothetical protein